MLTMEPAVLPSKVGETRSQDPQKPPPALGPTTEKQWFQPGLDFISNSGFFVPCLTKERLSPMLALSMPPEASTFGVGCVWTAGVSEGVPVDTLGMIFRQLLFDRHFGIKTCIVTIGRDIAAANDRLDLNDKKTCKRIEAIEAWHREIFKKIKPYYPGMKVLSDTELRRTQYYMNVEREREGIETVREKKVHRYSLLQDILFETIRREYGAVAKGGWATPVFIEERSVQLARKEGSLGHRLIDGHVNAGGGCEGVFDSWSMESFPGMAYLYGRPAVSFCPRQAICCPYTAKPLFQDGQQVKENGKPVHGRVLLHQDAPETLKQLEESLYVELNPKLRTIPPSQLRACVANRIDAISSLFDLCRLAEAALPANTIKQDYPLELDVQSALTAKQKFVKTCFILPVKGKRKKAYDCDPNALDPNRYYARLHEHEIWIAEAKRDYARHGVKELIRLFGATGELPKS